MATSKEIKFVQITVRLGSVPRFEVHADERVRIPPSDAKYSGKGVSTRNAELLQEILSKLQKGYPAPSIQLCIDEDSTPKEIVTEDNCQ